MPSVCGRASNTETTYIEVVSMLGMCRKASKRKHTHIEWFPCSACVEGVEHENHPNIEVVSVLGVCGRAPNTKHTHEGWFPCVLTRRKELVDYL